jgi:hypothetical protein
LTPAISFPPPTKHHRRHAISLHPDLAQLVAEEEEKPLLSLEDEPKLEVHHKNPMPLPMFLVSASLLPA